MTDHPLLLPGATAVMRHNRPRRYLRAAAIFVGIVAIVVGFIDVTGRFFSGFGPATMQQAFAPLPTVVLPGE